MTHKIPLPGAEGLAEDEDLDRLAREVGRPFPEGSFNVGLHLATTYGARAREVSRLAAADPELARPLYDDLPFCWAEVVYAARSEHALTITDALVRRMEVFYRASDQGRKVMDEVADRLAAELGWSEAERRRQIESYKGTVQSNRAWRAGFAHPSAAATPIAD